MTTRVVGARTQALVFDCGPYRRHLRAKKRGEQHIFAGGRRVASRKGSSTFYFHPDHLGSLSLVTYGAGASYQAETYYPFGEARNPDPADPAELEYKFTGQANDPETGLYYYGARFYDSEIGRFISPDSIVQAPADPQTLNRYSYCRNNPLMYPDPSGHWFFAIALGAFIGASMSAITAGNVGMGMLAGAISGAFFFAAGELGGGILTHVVAGAASGSVNAGLTGGDLGMSALVGGISAGIAEAAGQGLAKLPGFKEAFKPAQNAMQFGTQTAVGAVAGGLAAELTGGNFGQGAAQGALTAAYGFAFNYMFHPNGFSEYKYDVSEVDTAISQGLIDAGAGYTDYMTLGGTSKVREWLGVDYLVDMYSGNYAIGSATGLLYSARLGRFVEFNSPHKGLGPHMHYGPFHPGSSHAMYHLGPRTYGQTGSFSWSAWRKAGRTMRWY